MGVVRGRENLCGESENKLELANLPPFCLLNLLLAILPCLLENRD